MTPLSYKIISFFLLVFVIYKQISSNNRNKYLKNKYFKSYSQIDKKVNKDGKIFVSIASYRDPQLIHTVKSLLDNCHNVSMVNIVICEQNHIDDKFDLPNNPNIKIIKMNSEDARGPCWARYKIQQEWNSEQYYLQIDSHTRFVKDWDIKLKNQLSLLPDLSCLSNYVSTFDINTGNVLKSPLRGKMYVSSIDPVDQFTRFNAKYVKENSLSEPMISKGWSGCFSFSSSQIIMDAPYDPNTPFLFFGEEMDIFARLWTRGWTMYVPSIPICFTLFDRSYRKTFWEHPDCKDVSYLSRERIYARFKKVKLNNVYSLGSKKTMDQFMEYIKID
jgi:[Skp1-protein]-hydroxyproline N-acetylglucosaminyltransferase